MSPRTPHITTHHASHFSALTLSPPSEPQPRSEPYPLEDAKCVYRGLGPLEVGCPFTHLGADLAERVCPAEVRAPQGLQHALEVIVHLLLGGVNMWEFEDNVMATVRLDWLGLGGNVARPPIAAKRWPDRGGNTKA